jgi:spore maturation protein CgeB
LAQQTNLVYSDDYLDGWKWGFSQIGCEVREFDISPLNNIPLLRNSIYSARGWGDLARGMSRQMLEWKPDLLWVHHGRYGVHLCEWFNQAGVPTAAYLCDEPYETGETLFYAPNYTHVFSMDLETIPAHLAIRGEKRNVHYLLPAVNADRFRPGLYAAETGRDGVFIGNASLVPRPRFFRHLEGKYPGRAAIFYWKTVNKQSSEWLGLDRYPEILGTAKVGLNVHRSPRITEDCYRKRVLNGRNRTLLPPGFQYCNQPPAEWGTGFWNDLDLPASHVNPRFFETAALGTFQISDAERSELKRLFPMAVTCATPEDFADRFFYFLDHAEERRDIAKACCDLTLSRHTYKHRCAEILLRVGLWDAMPESLSSSLGPPQDWMHTQSFPPSLVASSSEPTGPSSFSSPPISKSSTPPFGTISTRASPPARRLS